MPNIQLSQKMTARAGIPICVIDRAELPKEPSKLPAFVESQLPPEFHQIDLGRLEDFGSSMSPRLEYYRYSIDTGKEIWPTLKPDELSLGGPQIPVAAIIIAEGKNTPIAANLGGMARVPADWIEVQDTEELREQLHAITMEHEYRHTKQRRPGGAPRIYDFTLWEWDAEQGALRAFKDDPVYKQAIELTLDARALGNFLFANRHYSIATLLDQEIPYRTNSEDVTVLDWDKARQMITENDIAFAEMYVRSYARAQGNPIIATPEEIRPLIVGASNDEFGPTDKPELLAKVKAAFDFRNRYTNKILNREPIERASIMAIFTALRHELRDGTVTDLAARQASQMTLKAAQNLCGINTMRDYNPVGELFVDGAAGEVLSHRGIHGIGGSIRPQDGGIDLECSLKL